MASGPLSGLRVVAIEQAVAAPFASARLADAGADVLKIERPEGDFARGYDAVAKGQSSYFVWLNRGKRSLALDLKEPEDKARLLQEIAKADVVIQNLRLQKSLSYALLLASPYWIMAGLAWMLSKSTASKFDRIINFESASVPV